MAPTPDGGGPERAGARRRPARRGPAGGTVTAFVSDEQSDQPVDTARWAALAEAVLGAEGVEGEAEVSVLFVDEAHIASLNQAHMGEMGPTDVLAFPIDGAGPSTGYGWTPMAAGRWPDAAGPGPGRSYEPPDEEPLLVGDVVVCPAVAARQASDHAGSLDDELALLVVHGLLHLLGHDHGTDEERREMQERERALLGAHHGALAGDPWKPGSPS
jgi:probable rRNA maturation factor